jgi:hypothetical protein
VDLNGDGHSDLLSGSYSRMSQPMAGLFQVLWGQADGSFKKAETLKGTDSEPLIIPAGKDNPDGWVESICTRPTAEDWDADGDLDLVVGNYPGNFYLFTGEGSGKFRPQAQLITAQNSPLKINGVHADPFLADWDRDGDLDLFSGSSNGGVYWAENIAGKQKPPELKPFQTLIEPGQRIEYGQVFSEDKLTGPTQSTRVWIDDVNEDGKLDVLVGDSIALISPAKGLSEEQFKQQYAEWQKKIQAASEKASKEADKDDERDEAIQELNKLYEEKTKFMSEERTGFVWLYVRK